MNKAKEQPQSRIRHVWSKPEIPNPVENLKKVPEKKPSEPIVPAIAAPIVQPEIPQTKHVEATQPVAISDKLFRVSIEYEADTIYSLDDLLTETRRSNGWNISRSDFFRAFMKACQEKKPNINQCRNYSELVQYFKKVLG